MLNLKIHILYNFHAGPFGGQNQFLKALKKNLMEKGVYEEEALKADIILYHSFKLEHFIEIINLKLKFPKKLFINRIDGPIYLVRGTDPDIDHIIYDINSLIADGTIFQSEWSKEANQKEGLKKNRFENIILNASDPDIFNPKNKAQFKKLNKIRLITTSWSSNWNKGFKIYKYLDENLNFSKYEMTFIGKSPIKFRNIKWIKPLKSEDLAFQLKHHDIFITASQYESCSNSLIEALNCGLPAIVLNDGGNPEIISKAGLFFNILSRYLRRPI